MVEISVLRRVGPTEWASPTFCTSKENGRIQWILDTNPFWLKSLIKYIHTYCEVVNDNVAKSKVKKILGDSMMQGDKGLGRALRRKPSYNHDPNDLPVDEDVKQSSK